MRELSTLRLLDISLNDIIFIQQGDLPAGLIVLNIDENASCISDYGSLYVLQQIQTQGQLKLLNPPDIRNASCFQNFREIAFGVD